MSGRVTIVGELNPYGADPAYALYPLPEGASGARLRDVLGLTTLGYLGTYARANLCVGRWSIVAAREAAVAILRERRGVILLGRRVAAAFGLARHPPFSLVSIPVAGSGSMRIVTLALLPHPSGRCREWDAPRAVEKARSCVRMLHAAHNNEGSSIGGPGERQG